MTNRRDGACPVLITLDGTSSHVVRLDRPLTIVGAKLQSHLRIVSQSISGAHALLLNLGNHVFLRDLMSRTHSFVNDRPVGEAQLKYGDVLRFGEMRFRFTDAEVVRQSLARLRSGSAELILEDGLGRIGIDSPLFVIGRQAGADLVFKDAKVSKAHAVLYAHGGGRMLRDLGSRDGTFVNGSQIRSIALRGGELIRIGTNSLRYRVTESEENPFGVPGQMTSVALDDLTTADSREDQGGHVFVDGAVVVTDPLVAPPTTAGAVASFLAGQTGGSIGDLQLVDPASPEPQTMGPFNSREGESASVDDLPGRLAIAAGPLSRAVAPETPALPALVEDASTESVLEGITEAPSPEAVAPSRAGGSDVASAATPPPPPQAAENRLELVGADDPVFADPPPVAISKPTLLSHSQPAAPTTPPPPEVAVEPRHEADPLAEILGDQVLTLYADPAPPSPERRKGTGGFRRRFWVAVVIVGVILLVIAGAAGGFWWYRHHYLQ